MLHSQRHPHSQRNIHTQGRTWGIFCGKVYTARPPQPTARPLTKVFFVVLVFDQIDLDSFLLQILVVPRKVPGQVAQNPRAVVKEIKPPWPCRLDRRLGCGGAWRRVAARGGAWRRVAATKHPHLLWRSPSMISHAIPLKGARRAKHQRTSQTPHARPCFERDSTTDWRRCRLRACRRHVGDPEHAKTWERNSGQQ